MVVTEAKGPIYRALWELTAVLPTAVLDALYAILTQSSHHLRGFHVITRFFIEFTPFLYGDTSTVRLIN